MSALQYEFDFKFEEADSIDSLIHLAIGAASVCWEDMSNTGVFREDRARAIAQQLKEELKRRLVPLETL